MASYHQEDHKKQLKLCPKPEQIPPHQEILTFDKQFFKSQLDRLASTLSVQQHPPCNGLPHQTHVFDHLQENLNTLVFSSFQAGGSLVRKMRSLVGFCVISSSISLCLCQASTGQLHHYVSCGLLKQIQKVKVK